MKKIVSVSKLLESRHQEIFRRKYLVEALIHFQISSRIQDYDSPYIRLLIPFIRTAVAGIKCLRYFFFFFRLHVFFILRTRFSRQTESFLVFLPYEPRMFLKCFNKSSPNHHSDDSDVSMFVRRKKKKNRADPYAFKAFQQLQKVLHTTKKTIWLLNQWHAMMATFLIFSMLEISVRYTLYINMLTFVSLVVF